MTQRAVLITEYDPTWLELFERERENIHLACGSKVCDVHHIGSTAIPGLPAKPIIDLLVTVHDDEGALLCIGPLRGLGYQYRGTNGIEGRQYLTKGDPRTHHLHMYAQGHPAVPRHLKFRDYLRSHPEEALAYGELTIELGRRFATDSESYSRAKGEFCRRIDWLVSGDGGPKS